MSILNTYEDIKTFFSHEDSVLKGISATGTVYTPHWTAQQMVFLLIKNHITLNANAFNFEGVNFDVLYHNGYLKNACNLEEIEGLSYINHKSAYKSFIEALLSLKILDLSCGSGVLLMCYVEFMAYAVQLKYRDITKGEQLEVVPNGLTLLKRMIETNVFGVDIHHDAIRNARAWFNSFAEHCGFVIEHMHLYTGHSLIDVLPFEENSFDFVIGNPPYIGEKNNLKWFESVKNTEFGKWTYEGKMDYFYFFIYKGWSYLKPKGSLCYLSSNYFLTADGAKQLRTFMRKHFNISRFVDYGDLKVFPEKKLHASVYVLQKEPCYEVELCDASLNLIKTLPSSSVYRADGTFGFVYNDDDITTLNVISGKSLGSLHQFYSVNQGIVTGYDKAFVYGTDHVEGLPQSIKCDWVPFYKNSDIKHFWVNENTPLRLVYVDASFSLDALKVKELTTLLDTYKNRLDGRREVINGVRKWYELTWPRSKNIFEQPKIVAPQRAKSNHFAFTEMPFYASADVYYITYKEDCAPYSLEVLCLILNSSYYLTWLKNYGKRKGQLLELYATPLKNLPVLKLTDSVLMQLEQLTKEVKRKNASAETVIQSVDKILSELF